MARRPAAHDARESADEALIRSLYQEHGRALLAYATRLTNDRAAAEDIVQETLVRAWRHADAMVNGRGSVRGWLLTVARNIATDRVRARAARPPEVAEVPDTAVGAEADHAQAVVDKLVVLRAMDVLSPDHRRVLQELYLHGRSVAEAAAVLDVAPGTVKSRSFYALRAMRAFLEAGAPPLGGGVMTTGHGENHDLTVYVLGALDDDDAREVERHLANCQECRDELRELQAMTRLLGEVPPEALLDGPPEDGELVLRRAVRQVRTEARARRTRRARGYGAAAAVAAVALVAGGVVAGRELGRPSPTPTASSPVAGTRLAVATDPGTGAALRAEVVPAAGWVRVAAEVRGIPAGQRCRLVIVDKANHSYLAGSWLVSPMGAANGTKLDGSALVDPAQVASVRVESTAGTVFVTARL